MTEKLTDSFSAQPILFLITGIMAAGKSSVAQRLAERLPNSVHLRGDSFRRMIVNGRAEMDLVLSPAAQQQLDLPYRLAAASAELYLASRFSVVYQDIIIGPDLATVIQMYRAHPLHLVVLAPIPAAEAQRETERNKTGYGGTIFVDEFDQLFRAETPRIGLWIDSSTLTVDETVDHILANLAHARITFLETKR